MAKPPERRCQADCIVDATRHAQTLVQFDTLRLRLIKLAARVVLVTMKRVSLPTGPTSTRAMMRSTRRQLSAAS